MEIQRNLFKIAVTPKRYDDIGAVLTLMGFDYTIFEEADFISAKKLHALDILFMNCGGTPPITTKALNNVKEFIANGGALYASDWASDWVEALFPGMVEFFKDGEAQQLVANVTDADLQDFLHEDKISLKFDLGIWHGIRAILKKDLIRQYLRGKRREAQTEEPMLISFSWEKGFVIFTTFHNEKQVSEVERHLLEYLVVKPLMHKKAQEAQEYLANMAFIPSKEVVGALEIGIESQYYDYYLDQIADLSFVFNWEGEAINWIEILDPKGRVWVDPVVKKAPYVVEIPIAPLGLWKFKIMVEKAPMKKFPYTINVGIKLKKTDSKPETKLKKKKSSKKSNQSP